MNRLPFSVSDLKKNERIKPIIGHYGFWVKLTYLSVVSALFGMYFALGGNIGYAVICLMISGLCDMFDGPVARLKNRTTSEESYGVQIDALADIISFGIFPVVIGYASGPHYLSQDFGSFAMIMNILIAIMYILTALIRLAYFNVIEIELQRRNEKRTYFEGLPVTSVAIIIPLFYAICVYLDISLSSVYNILLVLMSIAFVLRIKIPKLSIRQLLVFLLIGIPVIIYILWSLGGSL